MKLINKTLKKEAKNFLRTLKGKKLKSFKGYELFEKTETCPSSTWHETLVFQVGQQDFSIENQFQTVPFSDDDGKEDFAVLEVSDKAEEIWIPAGVKANTVKIEKTIQDILIVDVYVEYKNTNERFNAFLFSQAIVFCFQGECLVINRDAWFNDFLTVEFTSDYKSVVRRVDDDWMCEDGEYVDVKESIEKL